MKFFFKYYIFLKKLKFLPVLYVSSISSNAAGRMRANLFMFSFLIRLALQSGNSTLLLKANNILSNEVD